MDYRSLLCLILAYALGGIPFGLWMGFWVKKIDIRRQGSCNTGATNVFRVVGKPWGILVLFLDASKGYFAAAAPGLILGPDAGFFLALACGVTAILGHSFSPWLSFKGGKGVATSLGVFLAIAWLPTLMSFAVFAVVFSLSRIISISSLSAAASFPVMIAVSRRAVPEFKGLLAVSVLLACFIIYTHRANIGRLLRGEEKRLF